MFLDILVSGKPREITMRVLVVGSAVLLLMALPASDVGAKTTKRHAKRYMPYIASHTIQRHRFRYQDPGWYEHDANKLPFGSMRWWEQMRREDRLGGETP